MLETVTKKEDRTALLVLRGLNIDIVMEDESESWVESRGSD